MGLCFEFLGLLVTLASWWSSGGDGPFNRVAITWFGLFALLHVLLFLGLLSALLSQWNRDAVPSTPIPKDIRGQMARPYLWIGQLASNALILEQAPESHIDVQHLNYANMVGMSTTVIAVLVDVAVMRMAYFVSMGTPSMTHASTSSVAIATLAFFFKCFSLLKKVFYILFLAQKQQVLAQWQGARATSSADSALAEERMQQGKQYSYVVIVLGIWAAVIVVVLDHLISSIER